MYWFVAPGAAVPHGYSCCSAPPAPAYSHSASLGRKPPSQMQKAYASNQFSQTMGSFSLTPGIVVHVAFLGSHSRFVSVGATLALSAVTQPGSKPTALPL